MFCKKCGAKISDDAAFCTACGAPTKTVDGIEPISNSKKATAIVLKGATPPTHAKSNGKQKTVIIVAVLLLIVATITGMTLLNRLTPEEEILVKQVTEQIDEIGNVTINSGFTIKVVTGKYDSLSSKCQRHVKNRKILNQAQRDWNQLKADEAIEKINGIGEVTIDSKESIANARKIYDELSDEQKKLVKNYQTLVNNERSFEEVQIRTLIARIDALDRSVPINRDMKQELTNIQTTYDALNDAQKEKVTNYSDYKNIYNTYREKSVAQCIKKIDEIGEVTLEDTTLLDEAGIAYTNVFAADAKNITNLKTLTEAQNTLTVLKKAAEEKAKTIVAGDLFETEHWSIKLVQAKLTSKILPNSLSGYYNYYYQTDGSIYADLKFTIKNTGVSIRSIESILDTVSVSYGSQYNYTSYALFTSSGNDVDKVYDWDGLDALNSTTLHVAVGLPEEALKSNEPVKASIIMEGVEKIINIR